jgi:hypothetical protein
MCGLAPFTPLREDIPSRENTRHVNKNPVVFQELKGKGIAIAPSIV